MPLKYQCFSPRKSLFLRRGNRELQPSHSQDRREAKTTSGEPHPHPSGHASKGRPRLGPKRNAQSSPPPGRPLVASDRLTEAPGPAHPQALPARGTHSPAAAPQEGCRPLAARLTNGSVEPRRQIRFKIADQPIREHHPHDNACVRARGR